jgi:hypothetical protein
MKYENIIVTIYIKSIDQYDFVYYSEYLITVYFINALLYPYTIQYNTIQYFYSNYGPSWGNNKYTFIIISTVTTIQNGDISF